MKTSHMHKTDWKFYTDTFGEEVKSRLEYGYHYLQGNTDAHVSVTQETRLINMRGGESFGVASKELVAEQFPEILPLVRWHLSGVTTGPMHYVANALYWWDICHGRDQDTPYYSPDRPTRQTPEEARHILLDHIVYGTLERDTLYDPVSMSREELKVWLERRQPELVTLLRADCDPIALLTEAVDSVKVA